MLLTISCPSCGHVGLAKSEILPRDLVCSHCSASRHVEARHGRRIVNRVALEEWLFGAPGSPRAQ
jgi:hypothetical protein